VGAGKRGDTALVLLHGWGAQGDDLVPLARELARPNTTIFVPAAPLAEGSGRAFWHFDPTAPRAYALTDSAPPGYQPNPEVASARRAVQTLVRQAQERLAPARTVLAGFSQGAMLALDVALQCEPVVERVAVLSGALLFDSLPALRAACATRPRVLVAHGQLDPIVPFPNAEHAAALLERHGLGVDFRPFAGRHEIPREIRLALPDFLFAG
jgi:phospholipase/carboxylesterase